MITTHRGTMTIIWHGLRNMYYKQMVWIANRLTEDVDIPQEACNPVSLFENMMQLNHLSWGHYVCYIRWLHWHFPLNGPSIFRYLKKTYPSHHYSFLYLLQQWLLYHGFKTILAVHQPFGTRLIRWCQRIFPSPEDQ